jgi:hypothetical protein
LIEERLRLTKFDIKDGDRSTASYSHISDLQLAQTMAALDFHDAEIMQKRDGLIKMLEKANK